MWQQVIWAGAWFFAMFSAPFSRSAGVRSLSVLGAAAVAAALAGTPGIDPLAWLSGAAYSALAMWTGARCRRWSRARLSALEAEIRAGSERLSREMRSLETRDAEADALGARASEISHLYDKTQRMSQCLDTFEAFWVLAEALTGRFRYGSMKLALFNDEEPKAWLPLECYGFSEAEFSALIDRGVYLRDRSRAKTPVYPAETRVFERVLSEKKAVFAADGSSQTAAYPISTDGEPFAVLLLSDAPPREMPMLSILTERFCAELRRIRLYERVQALAITDGLTGVCARHHLLERFETELERSKRLGLKLSFLMLDIDHFKRFNDEYGHLVGDQVLKQAAAELKKSVRELDIVGRYGGEEFGILLVETGASEAHQAAERLRRAIAEKAYLAYEEPLRVTVSIGVATFSEKLDTVSRLVDAADGALYRAKREGRNRVCVSGVLEV
jgi:diguanylate cyclase (GGDEF)-like protein